MIFKYNKHFALVLSFFSASCIYTMPTHQEIMDELAQLRKESARLEENFTPEVQSFLNEIDEAKILDETKDSWDYWTKYAAFTLTTPGLRKHVTLLTKENAPKTYEFVASVAQKVGFTELPLIYLVNYEKYFNAFATGLLHSMSLIALGEELVQGTKDSQALEFLIAHELAHVYNRHIPKQLALGLAATAVVIPAYLYAYVNPTIKSVLGAASAIITAQLLTSWLSRVHERDADITAARAVGAQGGIDLFNLFKTKTASRIDKDYELLEQEIKKSSLKNNSSFVHRVCQEKLAAKRNEQIQAFLKGIIGTHPSDDERIAYLTEILKEEVMGSAETPTETAQA